jgi:hypothetical protein
MSGSCHQPDEADWSDDVRLPGGPDVVGAGAERRGWASDGTYAAAIVSDREWAYGATCGCWS